MRRAARLAWAAALVAGLAAPAAATEDDDTAARAAMLLKDGGCQVERPAGDLGGDDLPSTFRGRSGRGADVPGPVSSLLQVLFWGLLIAACCGLALALLIELRRRFGDGGPAAPLPAQAAAADRRPPPDVAEVEALAAAGRFGEAARLLLLRVHAWLTAQHPEDISDSLTSREVLGASGLDGPALSALGDLVGVVEAAHFAGRPTGRPQYERAFGAFRTLEALLARPA